jgi:transcription elongation factor GreA
MTQEGYDRLRIELEILTTTTRAELGDRLREARADGGDPAENAELMDAIEERVLLEQRISALKAQLGVARVAEAAHADGVARIGTRVRLRTPDSAIVEYVLVGAAEADVARRRISIASPVGRAIVGERAGAAVEVQTPRRRVRFELISVAPVDQASNIVRAA